MFRSEVQKQPLVGSFKRWECDQNVLCTLQQPLKLQTDEKWASVVLVEHPLCLFYHCGNWDEARVWSVIRSRGATALVDISHRGRLITYYSMYWPLCQGNSSVALLFHNEAKALILSNSHICKCFSVCLTESQRQRQLHNVLLLMEHQYNR